MEKLIKTKKDLLTYLERCAKDYAPLCKQSVTRNCHNFMKLSRQKQIDAILVDFVNFIGSDQGLDWGLKTDHLLDIDENNLDEQSKDQVYYVVHYKWQEGAELFFNRVIITSCGIRDEDDVDKLEGKLITILRNDGMEEELLSTVVLTGLTKL